MKHRSNYDEVEHQRVQQPDDEPQARDPETLDLFDFLYRARSAQSAVDEMGFGAPQKPDLPATPPTPLPTGDRGSEGQARARTTDPETSHRAARAIPNCFQLNGSADAVLRVLAFVREEWGGKGIIDERIVQLVKQNGGDFTGQRLRTARHDLVRAGFVAKVGEGRTARGYAADTWAITDAGYRLLTERQP